MQEVSKKLSLLWTTEQGWAKADQKEAEMQIVDDEQRLLCLIRRQPEQGLAEAIKIYGGLVQAVVRRALGADLRQDVEECTSEVFWRLYQGMAGFEEGRSLKSYLCGIARHVALDRRRRLGRTAWQEMPEEAGLAACGSTLTDPAEQLAAGERQHLVQQCVDAMPQPDRDIFILRYYFGEQVKVIAARLGLEAKAVENRLYQGRLRLKKTLVERGIEL